MTEACCLREIPPVEEDWLDANGQDPPVVIPEWSSADLVFAAEELFGYPRDELIGKSLLKSDLLPRKQLPRAAGYFAQNAMGRPVGPVELRLHRKDGTQVHMETRTCPVQIGGQHVVLGIARDITQRKKAEESLRESEEKFKIIFEEAHEGIVYLDDSGRVLEVNRNTLEILGQAKEQIVGKHFIELGILDPGDLARFLNHFQQVLLSNAVKYLDKPDGRIRVGCAEEGDFWRFHVTDNGPGIEERHFERIFRIFQTLAPKDDGESTGIGLALVKKIVERYGGKIWVESAVGKGSTFCFTWPKTKEEEQVWENR